MGRACAQESDQFLVYTYGMDSSSINAPMLKWSLASAVGLIILVIGAGLCLMSTDEEVRAPRIVQGGGGGQGWKPVTVSKVVATLPMANGGTCCASYTVGEILYASPKQLQAYHEQRDKRVY